MDERLVIQVEMFYTLLFRLYTNK